MGFSTFVEKFVDAMGQNQDDLALVYFDLDGIEHQVSRGAFLRAAQQQAETLGSQGVGSGDILVLVLSHNLDLFSSIWGALLVGAIPIIYSYISPFQDREVFLERAAAFGKHVRCNAMIAPPEIIPQLKKKFRTSKTKVLQVNAVQNESWNGETTRPVKIDSIEETAIIQFSSGTTGEKKGVMLSHRAIENYLEGVVKTLQISSKDVIVSWLPLYHDMGLIACFILPLTSGIPVVSLSPYHWLADPNTLFQVVHKYKGSITMMPNFGFSFSAKNVSKEGLEGVDLSSWRLVINGAEMVRTEDMEAFQDRFSPYGLRPSALSVGYGMAECVLGVSRTRLGEKPKVDWVNQQILNSQGFAVPGDPDSPSNKPIVSCGIPHPDVEIEVVDEHGTPTPERVVGEIKIRSSTLFSGYYSQPKLTRSKIVDGWFFTEDLGYLNKGELYVCGRKSDLIIVQGANIYPGDIEKIVGGFKEVRRGRAAAFGVQDIKTGTESIVIVCELKSTYAEDEINDLSKAMNSQVWKALEVPVSEIKFAERGWIIKTTSGKIARPANREKYLLEKEKTRQ